MTRLSIYCVTNKRINFLNGFKFIEISEKMVLHKLCDTTYKYQIQLFFNAYSESAYPYL